MTRDEIKQFDVRTLERNLRKGVITRKDVDKFLKTIPDCSANAVWSSIEDGNYDDSDDLDEPSAT